MTSPQMRAGGVVVFWQAAESRRDVLEKGLTALKLQAFVPEPRTPFAVLKDSLEAVFPGKEHLIRATDDDDTFNVVKEERGAGENKYEVLGLATALQEVDPADVLVSSSLAAYAPSIKLEFAKRLPILHASSVTGSIVDVVLKHFKGTSLRPHGGIYWIEDKHDAEWQKVALAFEACGDSRLYTMRIKFDTDMVRAVSSAVTAEISAEAEQIEKDLVGGELGERACENRETRIQSLLEKVEAYESALGVTLNVTRDVLDRSKTAAAAAMLKHAAAAQKGAA